MRLPRRRVLTLAAAAALAPALGWGSTPLPVMGGPAFGTYWRLTLAGNGHEDAIRARIGAVIARIDAAMSPYAPESELSRLNRSRETGWLPVSPALGTVLDAARVAHAATGGAFDPTVGPIVARYGLGPIRGEMGGGFGAIGLEAEAIRKDVPGVTIDLNGIAKGHALDLMGRELEGLGLRAFLLDLGGELIARGHHPEGRPWHVMVEPAAEGAPVAVLPLGDMAVATSGDAEQGYTLGGRRYAHVIDPETEEPAAGGVASVSVIAPTAMEADALATGLMAMGSTRGPATARVLGIAARFQLRGPGGIGVVATPAFARLTEAG